METLVFYKVEGKNELDRSHTVRKLCHIKLNYFGNQTISHVSTQTSDSNKTRPSHSERVKKIIATLIAINF